MLGDGTGKRNRWKAAWSSAEDKLQRRRKSKSKIHSQSQQQVSVMVMMAH